MPLPRHPNYTQFPNTLLDNELAELSLAEWKVLCYLVRHTFGWQRDAEVLSYKQFIHGCHDADGHALDKGCGITSSTTLGAALRSLEEHGLIRREHRSTPRGGKDSSCFRLVFEEEDDAPLQQAANGSTHAQKMGMVCPENGHGTPENGHGTPENGHGTPATVHPSISTKETVPKETVREDRVPGIVSINERPSAHARAGSPKNGHSPSDTDVGRLDPQAPWLAEMVEAIHKHWRGKANREDLNRWAAALWEQLHDSTPQERADFQSYLFDGPYLSERSNPSAVETTIRQDAERWKLRNKPSSKSSVRPARVPAHVQQERDRAYKPPKETPERTERIFARLRKFKGEEFAQRWLEEHNTGT